MNTLPLLRDFGTGSPTDTPAGAAGVPVFAYRAGVFISVDQFLVDVARLGSMLPNRAHLLNLCADRYHFTVGFAAALLRGQISLLPPNHTPDLIGQLLHRYPGLYCLTDADTALPTLETVFYPAHAPAPVPAPVPADSGLLTASVPLIPAEQTAAILFTSGSTGEPAATPKSWGSLVGSGRAEIERLQLRPGTVILGTVPPQHMYGLESTVLIALQGGLVLHAGRPFYTADILAELEALPRPRALVTTPVHLRALLAETADFPSIDLLLCATAPLPLRTAIRAEERFAAPLIEIYGCTEAGQVASRRSVESSEWRPLRDLTLSQNDLGTWVSGGHVNGKVLLGDVIELVNGGTFLLHGRTADLVNIAGKRTSLAHLNYQLGTIEGVHDGVFVMPDENEEGVTRLMAFVVAPGLTGATVARALRLRIDAAFMPRPLCLVTSLPRNATGKLPRQAIEQMLTEFAAAE